MSLDIWCLKSSENWINTSRKLKGLHLDVLMGPKVKNHKSLKYIKNAYFSKLKLVCYYTNVRKLLWSWSIGKGVINPPPPIPKKGKSRGIGAPTGRVKVPDLFSTFCQIVFLENIGKENENAWCQNAYWGGVRIWTGFRT